MGRADHQRAMPGWGGNPRDPDPRGSVAALGVDRQPAAAIAVIMAPLLVAAVLVVAFLALLAWLIARSTAYTLTSHRLVMRLGIALPATLAIPHRAIAHAAITLHADGTGDVPIRTRPGSGIAYHRIWPHARPAVAVGAPRTDAARGSECPPAWPADERGACGGFAPG